MNKLLVLATVLLVFVTVSWADLRANSQPEFERFPEPLWTDLDEEQPSDTGKGVGLSKKAPALVRMVKDAAIVLHMEDDQELPTLLKEANNLRRATWQKLKSQEAKNIAKKLGEGLVKIEKKIHKKIQELMEAETDDDEETGNLEKMEKKVKEVAITLKILGQGKYVFIPYKYNGELAL